MSNNISKLLVDISKEDHKKLKHIAIEAGISLRELVVGCLQKHILKEKQNKKDK